MPSKCLGDDVDTQWGEWLGMLNTRWDRSESRKKAGVREPCDASALGMALKWFASPKSMTVAENANLEVCFEEGSVPFDGIFFTNNIFYIEAVI